MCTYVCLYVSANEPKCTYVGIYMYVCMCVCVMYVYVRIYIYVYVMYTYIEAKDTYVIPTRAKGSER